MPYLNHRPISNEVRPEVGDVFRKISDVANECSLEADLSLAQLVGSTLRLVIVFVRDGCHVREQR